jgi:3alpha(or 20beta)-hydroxysteroid dehydrogenase
MSSLDGKVLLVTGSARGLGEVVARIAVERGARVMLVDVRDERGANVADELGDHAEYLHLDVRDEESWAAGVAATVERFGRVDVLVNNAAILRTGALESFSVSDFRDLVEVNQMGPFLGMRAVIPAMRAAGGGSIVNVGSVDGMHGMGGVCAYAGTKWGLRGITKSAAQELGPLGIRVNAVHPGGIRTEMGIGVVVPGVELTHDQVKTLWALQRFPELFEVANLILYLASDEASYVTGQDIACDGGATIGPRYSRAYSPADEANETA